MWFTIFKKKPKFRKYNWRFVIIHHSATKENKTLPDIQAIRRYHIEHNGWTQIGYHAIVERINGKYETIIGRPWNMNGAHTKGMNTKALGACIVGDFSKNPPSQQAQEQLAILVRAWMDMFGIPIENIKGHRDYANKECPGKSFSLTRWKKDYLKKV